MSCSRGCASSHWASSGFIDTTRVTQASGEQRYHKAIIKDHFSLLFECSWGLMGCIPTDCPSVNRHHTTIPGDAKAFPMHNDALQKNNEDFGGN